MTQAVFRVPGLPEAPLDAASRFYAEALPKIRAELGLNDPPPRPGEDLVILFPTATHDHRGWRLAAVQELAREAAPKRVNAIAGDDTATVAQTLVYLENAPGVTGQLLAVDGKSPETR